MSPESSMVDLFSRVGLGPTAKTVFFDLATAPWTPVVIPPDGAGRFPPEIVAAVDLSRYFQGMEVQPVDCGCYNMLQTRVPPGFHVPRHRHNTDQVVLVVAGSMLQGRKEMRVGEGYATPAGNPYSLTAGPEGLTWLEVRTTPLAQLTTEWLDTDPARWEHRAW
jgi:hypothetical protein